MRHATRLAIELDGREQRRLVRGRILEEGRRLPQAVRRKGVVAIAIVVHGSGLRREWQRWRGLGMTPKPSDQP